MSVSDRDATVADAARLAALGARSFTETFGHLYTPANLAAFLQNHTPEAWAAELGDAAYAVRIVEDAGVAAGYAKLGPPKLPFTPPTGAIELRQLYVLAPWHGAGVGAALMAWVLDEARARDARELYLSVFVDNLRAQRFYARYGFERVGAYAFMVGDHEDEDHVMRLAL
jgi:diamine N-acetyltransferase